MQNSNINYLSHVHLCLITIIPMMLRIKWVGFELCETWMCGLCFPLDFNAKFNDYH